MELPFDHLFCWVEDLSAGDALLALGFEEGSAREHPGQGTHNRKFYWDNCFLELLAVQDVREFQSQAVAASGLTKHFERSREGGSPFGVVFRQDQLVDARFPTTSTFSPEYLPKGTEIQMSFDAGASHAPLLAAVPFPAASFDQEPRSHRIVGEIVHGAEFLGNARDFQDLFGLTASSGKVWFAQNKQPFLWIHLAEKWTQETAVPGLPIGFRH